MGFSIQKDTTKVHVVSNTDTLSYNAKKAQSQGASLVSSEYIVQCSSEGKRLDYRTLVLDGKAGTDQEVSDSSLYPWLFLNTLCLCKLPNLSKQREELRSASQAAFTDSLQCAVGSITQLCAGRLSPSETAAFLGKPLPNLVSYYMMTWFVVFFTLCLILHSGKREITKEVTTVKEAEVTIQKKKKRRRRRKAARDNQTATNSGNSSSSSLSLTSSATTESELDLDSGEELRGDGERGLGFFRKLWTMKQEEKFWEAVEERERAELAYMLQKEVKFSFHCL